MSPERLSYLLLYLNEWMKQYRRNKCRDIDTLKNEFQFVLVWLGYTENFIFFSLNSFFKANYNFLVFLWSLLILVLFHFYLLLRIFFLNIFFYSLKFVLSHFFSCNIHFHGTHFWCNYFLAFFFICFYNQLLTDNIFFHFKLLVCFFYLV